MNVTPGPGGGALLGQPRGFWVLFLLEMWERYTYFGARAILVLFLVSSAEGLGLGDRQATAIYGLYTAATYLAGLAGGWLADRALGARRAVLTGSALILAGDGLLTLPRPPELFFCGLIVIVFGVGLLKPCVSVMVAALYRDRPQQLDAAFTLYYVGICIGAAVAGVVTPLMAQAFGFRAGFAAAAVGTGLGLVQFIAFRRWLEGLGDPPPGRRIGLVAVAAGLALAAAALPFAHVALDAARLLGLAIWSVGLGAATYFVAVLAFGGLGREERRRVLAIAALCAACTVYWSGADLAGSLLNLFAERHTVRTLGPFILPAGVFQTVNPALIVVLGPLFSSLWVGLDRRGILVSSPAKFSLALIFVAAGLLIMAGAGAIVDHGGKAAPTWLLATYLLHTLGELLLSPVGLAALNRLAPKRIANQIMGVWFLSVALGTLIASQVAGLFIDLAPGRMGGSFLSLALIPAAAGVALAVLAPAIGRLSGTPEAVDA